mmetsp:Transcript_9083/g.13260  ORF Transcript_9083/g.13260 Transcript_9083/m.13260 type:complete len:296 (-) Transcript_9083:761-1648(-)
MHLPVANESFNVLHSQLQITHGWSVAKANIANARASVQITSAVWINIEKHTWNTDCLVLHAFFQKHQTIVQRGRELRNVGPHVKGCVWFPLHTDAHFFQFCQQKVAFHLEMFLQGPRIAPNEIQFHEGQRQTLQGSVGSALKKTSSTAQHVDHFLGSYNPADAETRTTPILGQTIDNQNGICVNIINVSSGTYCLGPVGVVISTTILGGYLLAIVVIMRVELIHDDRRFVRARRFDIFLEILSFDRLTGRIGRVRKQDATRTATTDLKLELFGIHQSLVDIPMHKGTWTETRKQP